MLIKPRGKESTEVQITQNKGKNREISYQKLKRSPKERHMKLIPDNFLLNFPPSIPLSTPGGTFQKLSSDAISVVCSHTFILF